VPSTSAVAQIASAQRLANARLTTATLGVLTLVAALVAAVLGAKPAVVALLTIAAAGQGHAYWLTRMGRNTAGVLLSSAWLLGEQVGAQALGGGALGPIPYMVPVVILLVAATATARWLPASFVACLVALAAEGWISPWARPDQQAIASAALYASIVFVVSLLHAKGTEHAFAIAEKQDGARASAAAAAMESERRYALIADSADDLITLVDAEGKALYLSPSHKRVLGLAREPTIGRLLQEHLNIENIEASNEAFIRALSAEEARVELVVRRSDGKLLRLDTHLKRVASAQGPLVAIISRDVTERRDLETRLQASERLEALGRLAGSVAHDFNNLLTVIQGASDLARSTLPANHLARADLDTVLAAAATATELTGHLLTFSRRQLVVRTRVDVGDVLTSQREVLERLVGPKVRLEYEVEGDLPSVLIPRAHVEQLALNLAGNARDAMPAGGRLLIRLRKRDLADREVGDLVAGPYVELEVHDEGVGIPRDVLAHVFEPLFTTKGKRGTGLGLATCFGIAIQAGGTIDFASEVGEGTTFRVLLPAAGAAEAGIALPATPLEVKRVLLVDDDANVREMTARMLRAEGHEVLAASTLAEARAVVDDGKIHLDALVTDVVLGADQGTDLIAPCRKSRPGMRIVVMSGYTPDPGASATVAAGGAAFLAKPFGRDQLLRVLRGERG
jgi:two-component system, cell cycle sensor histidine kinase and response regulator CckA